MPATTNQTAIIEVGPDEASPSLVSNTLALGVGHSVAIPVIRSDHDTLVRVLAVALNPTDFKMITYFPSPGSNNPVGCDFCGIVEDGSEKTLAAFPKGTKVFGGLFPYGRIGQNGHAISGAFAEWVIADANQLLRLPNHWSPLDGAAVGGICWGTCVLGLFADPEALALTGRPSAPDAKGAPILVYGGATATGTMACQLLKLSGYRPIAVTSPHSEPLAKQYGAIATASYTSATCAETVRSLAATYGGIRHTLDCITTQESVAICYAATARAGGRYACLEKLEDSWRTRKAIRAKEVMGFEGFGHDVILGANTYTRPANMTLYNQGQAWATEMQTILDNGNIKPHPVQEISGGWAGILEGLKMLQNGEVRGKKLVVVVASE